MTDDKPITRRPGAHKSDEAWTDEERAAIEEYRRERRRSTRPRRRSKKAEADGEAEVLAKIAGLDEPDHAMADKARLDDGPMWPIVYALPEMTPAVEAQIIALVKKAVS
jgi:hypothetical protein